VDKRRKVMSFKCQICGQAQPTKTAPIRVVTRVQTREYADSDGWRGVRTEIVEEKMACYACALKAGAEVPPTIRRTTWRP
jgi:hypothetical protein